MKMQMYKNACDQVRFSSSPYEYLECFYNELPWPGEGTVLLQFITDYAVSRSAELWINFTSFTMHHHVVNRSPFVMTGIRSTSFPSS